MMCKCCEYQPTFATVSGSAQHHTTAHHTTDRNPTTMTTTPEPFMPTSEASNTQIYPIHVTFGGHAVGWKVTESTWAILSNTDQVRGENVYREDGHYVTITGPAFAPGDTLKVYEPVPEYLTKKGSQWTADDVKRHQSAIPKHTVFLDCEGDCWTKSGEDFAPALYAPYTVANWND